MRAIFISYRRDDAEGQAGRLFTDLGRIFGQKSVFMDVTGIEAGRDFRRAIDEQLASCGVLLAVIGKNWADAADASGRRRLDDPHDFVRLETAAALKRDIPVIPVLVHGARMPKPDDLPPDMAELVYRNGVELSHARWESDVQVLAGHLRPYVDAPPDAAGTSDAVRPPAAASRGKGPLVVVASLIAALIVGVYLWRGLGNDEAPTGPGNTAPVTSPPPAQATSTPAKPRADEPPVEERRDAEAKAKAEASKRAEAAAAAEHRARWPSYDFPAPNGGLLVFTILPDGNPACASYDGSGCLWGQRYDEIDFSKVKPLVCGEAHRALYSVTGYENPMHWCSLARTVRPNRS